jgi:hypothetical protein
LEAFWTAFRILSVCRVAAVEHSRGFQPAEFLSTVRELSGVRFQLAMPRYPASWKLTPRRNRTVISRTMLSRAVIQPSLRDERRPEKRAPWVETHGWVHHVATGRSGLGRAGGSSAEAVEPPGQARWRTDARGQLATAAGPVRGGCRRRRLRRCCRTVPGG